MESRMDMQSWIDGFRENVVVWMLVFFIGILYWAFRARFQRPNKSENEDVAGRDR